MAGDPRLPTWGADPDGATELDADQRNGLKLSWVTTRSDLNQAEAENILKGSLRWRRRARPTARGRLTPPVLLDPLVARRLHRDMFGEVWVWAGTYRQRATNIGVAPASIQVDVVNLLADTTLWVGGTAPMAPDEAACMLHHRLVAIHPFPNGNGRHAREMADLLLICLGHQPFTWGQRDLGEPNETRAAYIRALRAADAGDYGPLADFVRS